jgi:uncharacterized protein
MLYRKLYKEVILHLDAREVTVIAGPRQSGKTTLLSQVAGFLKDKGENVVLLTLEDHEILSRLNKHPENVFDFIMKDESRRTFLLIDEVQYLSDPSNFLKLLYDKYAGSVKLIVTGSSAFYFDLKFKDSLAGRKRILELYTLSFDEFLEFRNGNDHFTKELDAMRISPQYRSAALNEIRTLFSEYLTYGGYPAVVLAKDPTEKILVLKDLLNSFVKRDILESKINDSDKFYRLMLLLAHQTGSLVNIHELSLTLRLSTTAVENYLYVLRKCYHIGLLKPFHGNIRKELTKMPKCYFHDLGLRNILMNQFNPVFQRIDRGEMAENYAFIRIREQNFPNDPFFWRTTEGSEIDFIIQKTENTGEAIEIKYSDTLFFPGKYKMFPAKYPDYSVSVRSIETDDPKRELMRL